MKSSKALKIKAAVVHLKGAGFVIESATQQSAVYALRWRTR